MVPGHAKDLEATHLQSFAARFAGTQGLAALEHDLEESLALDAGQGQDILAGERLRPFRAGGVEGLLPPPPGAPAALAFRESRAAAHLLRFPGGTARPQQERSYCARLPLRASLAATKCDRCSRQRAMRSGCYEDYRH